MSGPILQLEAVEKAFGGVRALKPFSLEIGPGEIVGLIGENGAGKSTVIKIISGLYAPDAGRMIWLGSETRFGSPGQALAAGIATLHQELAYFPRLTVAENLLLGEPWPRDRFGAVDWRGLHARARDRLDRFDLNVRTDQPFQELSAADKQEVAIARALARNARLLVLDEPTASLTEPEVARLFSHLARLRQSGVAILYVSHRLDEILAWTDRVAVLRDGGMVSIQATRETRLDGLVRDMVGRPLEQVYPRTRTGGLGEPLLEVENLARSGEFEDINFKLCAGEIVGLTGLVGAGPSELARTLYGLVPPDRGRMTLRGRAWSPASAHEAVKAGLVYLPEERKRQGLVLEHGVGESISVGLLDLVSRLGWIISRREQSRLDEAVRAHDIRCAGLRQPIGTLSGGNQQKALLARWLAREPSVILLNEPTRGVDVGAKAEIHALIDRLAARGRSVLLISSDLPEVLGMSDRVLVMCRGRIFTELRGAAKTQENAILASSGLLEPGEWEPGRGEPSKPALPRPT